MTSKTVKLAAALIAAAVVCASAVAADVDKKKPDPSDSNKSIVLGKTRDYPDAACTKASSCQVVARVTGIQMAAGGSKRPYQVPKDGQLASWWLTLPKMTESQVKSFSKLFGGEPAARVAVLRRGIKTRYRLVRQSETVQLKDQLGTKGRAKFKLAQPLDVKQGDYIGLTAVTWMPSFAVGLSAAGNSWVASRPKSRCTTPSSRNAKRFERYYKHSDAQVNPGAVPYDCNYETARLIYWARIVPTPPAPTTPTS